MRKLVNIGQLNFLLDSDDDLFWHFADRRYKQFFVGSDQQADEMIKVDVIANPEIPDTPKNSTSIRFLDHQNTVEMIRGRGMAIWDRASHYCHVRQDETDYLPQHKYPEYVIDSIIRIMLSFRLLDEGGCLVHSAGLVRDGKGYLFVGQSGAGKSTVSRISAERSTILSDDLNLVCLTGDGAQICGTPFFGEFTVAGTTICAPLVGIYFLQQAKENKITSLTTASALRRLLRSIMHFNEETTATTRVLELAREISTRTPCYLLEFTPDDSFWRFIHV